MRSLAAALLIAAAVTGAAHAAPGRCGTRPGLQRELAADHGLAAGEPRASRRAADDDRDVDDVAVIHDGGDLVIRRNPFDLDSAALRLTPRAGGYDVARLALALEPPGAALGLGDDDARAVDLGFAFPFFGGTYRQAFVHSDGHVTFGSADAGAGGSGLARVLDGPPRIAAFFADLDPSRGGVIAVRTEASRAVILWSGVPGAGQINRNSFQIALHADGAIDLAWGEMQTREAIVAVVPGSSAAAAPIDWSAPTPGPASGGVIERFSETERLDIVAATRRFLAGRADAFQQVVLYTTRALNPVPGTLAFEVNVKNEVQGIGLEPMDHAAEWGSTGTLESVVYMDSIDTYADVDGFEFLGHEVGHRWLARIGVGPLLGRGGVHWSFFLDSDASVMEGNAIADRGRGRFETVDFARRYSALDQYAMGLRLAAEVPPFFYVDLPDDFRPNRPYKASSAPEAGVSFTGVRREVHIEDVVRSLGPRVPALAPPVFRLGFVLVADDSAPATESRMRAVARIRSRFGPWFEAATAGRGTAVTTLR